jgi:GTP-binding protein LepA
MGTKIDIRNFSIIAHVDHGKSTLADRLIQLCGGLDRREMQEQVLDSMDLERERGITIKAQSVTLGTPARRQRLPAQPDRHAGPRRLLVRGEPLAGRLRRRAAGRRCSQGVEAQSVANCYTAIEQGLEVVPVINKIDLPSADPPKVIREIEEIIGIDATDAVPVSGQDRRGRRRAAREIVKRIPPPKGDPDAPLQALIVDSWFDNYVGVVSLVRVVNGSLKVGEKIRVMSTGRALAGRQARALHAEVVRRRVSGSAGEVGFVIAGIKEIDGAPVGDTITLDARPCCGAPLPGFKQIKPRCSRAVPGQRRRLRERSATRCQAQAQRLGAALRARGLDALGFGFRVRLPRAAAHGDRAGAPGARVQPRPDHERAHGGLQGASDGRHGDRTSTTRRSCPPNEIEDLREPIIIANILVPPELRRRGAEALQDKRGNQKKIEYLGTGQVSLQYELPLAEVVLDFFDKLKSVSRGYASFDYEFSRLPGGAAGQARHPDQRRQGRRAVDHRPPRDTPTSAAASSSTRCRS